MQITQFKPVHYPSPNEWLGECYPTRSDQNMANAYKDFAIRIYNETVAQQIYELGSPSTAKPLTSDDEKYAMWKTVAEIFGMISNALEQEGQEVNDGPLAWLRNSSYTG
jgi:alpha-glucuronidase